MPTYKLSATRKELPINYPLSATKGDDFCSPNFTHKNPDTGAAIDLTGYTITAQWNDKDGTLISAGTVVRDNAAGTYYFTIPLATVNSLTVTRVYYYIQVDDGTKATTYFNGPVEIKEQTP